jgi:hypothetical protein
MFKKFAVLCVIVCMGLVMAGCGGKKAAEVPKDTVEPITTVPSSDAAEHMKVD